MRWWPFRSPSRDAIQDDIRDELSSHVELRIQENLRRGMTPADAGREAAARFGPVRGVAVNCEKIQRRRESRARALWLDLRGSWLHWRRTPFVSLLGAAVGAVGLATALVAALLTDAVFLRQPPGMRTDATVFNVLLSRDGSRPHLVSYQQIQRLAAAAPEHQFFLWSDEEFQIDAGGRPAVWPGIYAGGEYFKALGVQAAAGRLLDRDDELARRPVVVVSRALARTLFGSAAGAPGKSLRVNGRPMQVVGVAGGGFRGSSSTARADVWLPVTVEALLSVPQIFPSGKRIQGYVDQPDIGWLFGGVRLTSADARAGAQSRYTAAVRAEPMIGAASEGDDRRTALLFDRIWLSPFSYEREQLAAVLKPIGIAVGLTLLLASACMSSLIVGRLVQRQPEFAIRLALGASRWQLLRLVTAEHAIGTAAASVLAAPLAVAALYAIDRLQIAANVRVASLAVAYDGRALAVLLILASILGATSLLGPLALARASTRGRTLTGGRVLSSGTRLRRVLMASQVATGCALLAAGGLLTRSIDHLRGQPRGFDAEQVAFVEIDLARSGLDDTGRTQVIENLRRRTRESGAAIALTTSRPYAGIETQTIHVDVPDRASEATAIVAPISRVEGPYFDSLGVRLIHGRVFAAGSLARREAIVSETFANYYWPGQNAIGRIVRVGGTKGEPHEVVGVVGATIDVTLRAGQTSRIYLPLDDDADKLLVVGRRANPRLAAATELTSIVTQIDERLSPARQGVIEDLALQSIEQRRVIRWMTIVVGTGSLLMVAVGVWGLAHTSVSRRWREFGLRLALGADRREVARLALRDAVVVTVAGVGLGVFAAWQFGRALGSFLFGVTPFDPATISIAALIVTIAVFAGAWFPARRASRADPSQLLRTL